MNWKNVIEELEAGRLRAAIQLENGEWIANQDVKKEILAAFKAGHNIELSGSYSGFVDKDNLPVRNFSVDDGVRLVPGGSSVRAGAYVAPSYINIGAYVDSGTMVDSHALVGSCAIGKNVHLSAAVQIGGVLEPMGMNPVVIEDDVFVGAGAVIAPSVVLSKGVAVYYAVNDKVLPKGSKIPENAVIVPGSRPINTSWAQENGLQSYCPIIIKYRDEKSDASLTTRRDIEVV
ncbi:2,3,4,5-tetrahydropyridine-2,6-dicarboxylate N-succinyltransferase [Francisella orientalis]|uniref:2,3,4,5-tetrahydropyridine-2,6-dicarboxylate N-succinyltransferase n=1 Tax=Francisella orientalis TaxID=299583 RepID=UPI0011EEA9D2|nr:2,3,4,5-tetrahydropyridine-2,6-dicarboxylate N-succinyltransferase [Francisella orientalis]